MPELRHPDPPLTDGVIALRAWADDDVAFLVDACRDPEVARYSPAIPSPYGERDAREWLASQLPARLAGTAIDFAIVRADDGAPLGAIGLGLFHHGYASAELGYWLAPGARGRGYMVRAVRLLGRWGFDALGLQRIALTTDPANEASQRVAERSGFTREGLMRSHLVVRRTDERRDSLLYSLLPGDPAP